MITKEPKLYQTLQIRSCEQAAINILGISEEQLMLRAGKAAFSLMQRLYPKVRTIAVFCGAGNNAGDGYILARLAKEKGYSVLVNQYKAINDLPPAAADAAQQAFDAGVIFQAIDDALDPEAELIIDALLGTGLKSNVHGVLVGAINQINDAGLPVFSLDLPSGLDADTGFIHGLAVKACATITFIGLKTGLFTLDGPDYCGELHCDNLGIGACLDSIPPIAELIDPTTLTQILPRRLRNSHKGLFGHVLIIGGGRGMPGSVYLAAQAALRVGAGAVTIATHPEHAGRVLPQLAEAMIYGIEKADQLDELMARATVCILGPGLGEDNWAIALYKKVITSQLPMVIDASALRLLSENPQHDDNWILTPHPGEASSLLHCSTSDIQADRFEAVRRLQGHYGGQVVLKGVGSLIGTDTGQIYLCQAGNPGMASAGMGDTLSGIIAGLLAQGVSLANAAKAGVWLHAKAGDEAALERGERGLLASDLVPYLQQLVNSEFGE